MPALDGLRAISILAIIGFHGGWPGFSGGGRGVDLFFGISGFLITYLLLKEKQKFGKINFRSFYLRRALRILPAFYLFLCVYAVFVCLIFLDFRPKLISSLVIAGTYTTNIIMGWFGRDVLVAHTWALSLEQQFYLLYPLLIGLMSNKRALIATSSLVVGVLLWRIALYSVFNVTGPPLRYAYSPDTRFDTILVGCVLGIVFSLDGANERLEQILPKHSIWISVSIILASIYLSERSIFFMYTAGYTLIACGCAVIIAATILRKNGFAVRFLSSAGMQVTGRLSYSLYLWHPLVLGLAGRTKNHFEGAAAIIISTIFYISVSFLFAGGSYLFIEKPFLRYKDRFSLFKAGDN